LSSEDGKTKIERRRKKKELYCGTRKAVPKQNIHYTPRKNEEKKLASEA
jgi:hypothetical protein